MREENSIGRRNTLSDRYYQCRGEMQPQKL